MLGTCPDSFILLVLISFVLFGEKHKLWSQPFPSSCFLLLLESKHSPQHPVLKSPQSTYVLSPLRVRDPDMHQVFSGCLCYSASSIEAVLRPVRVDWRREWNVKSVSVPQGIVPAVRLPPGEDRGSGSRVLTSAGLSSYLRNHTVWQQERNKPKQCI
jgi:hypothetical protein